MWINEKNNSDLFYYQVERMYWEWIHERLINEASRKVIAEIELKIKPAPKWIPKRLWLKLASLFIKLETKVRS